MRNTRYLRAQRARIRQRRINQYLMIPVEEFKVTKSFKIAIDTPKNCSCEMCAKSKETRAIFSENQWYRKPVKGTTTINVQL